jgi:UDP-glucose 4-epimerase
VLVTGALGVNGVFVLRSLLERGADVVATGRNRNFELAPDLEGVVPFERLDVRSLDETRRVLAEARPEVVVHLAAMMPGAAHDDPYAGFEVNVMGTANVLEAARGAGVERVVYTSSKGVYGAVTGRHGHPAYEPMPEDGPLVPVLAYDYSKLAGEGLGDAYARIGGPEFASMRFGSIYGPGKLKRHGPMSLASRLVEDPLAGRPVRVERGGEQRDDYLYVRDVGDAVALVALHPEPLRHRVYNVGSGRAATLEELAEAVRRRLREAEIELGPGLDPLGLGIPYYVVLDASRMLAEFGFRPRFDFDAGVADYVETVERLGAGRARVAGR